MGGGGKGGDRGQTSGSRALEQFTGEITEQSRPVRQELFRQTEEALRTGGVGARIPIITRAQESSRLATARALESLDENLVRTGLAGTPFGARARAETQLTGELATSAIPTEQAANIIQTFPGIATGTAQPVVVGLGGAASSQARLGAAQTAAKAGAVPSLIQAGGSIGGGFAGKCYIAYRMYGPSKEFIYVRWWVNTGSTWRARLARAIYFVLDPLFRSLLREAEERLEKM